MNKPLIIDHCSGAGEVICHSCKQRFPLTGFLHGSRENPISWKTYQCLQCGQLTQLEFSPSSQPVLVCSCGGTLCREHQAFCPACRSQNLSYDCSFLT